MTARLRTKLVRKRGVSSDALPVAMRPFCAAHYRDRQTANPLTRCRCAMWEDAFEQFSIRDRSGIVVAVRFDNTEKVTNKRATTITKV